MPKAPLYQQIAETVRGQILRGELRPGDPLSSVRQMAAEWGCTPGTVQQAYRLLGEQGLVVSRAGQGTRVGASVPAPEAPDAPMRRATLVHRAEGFLLEVLTAGYDLDEVESAFRLALDRWRTISEQPPAASPSFLTFVGSHDPAVSLIASRFGKLAPGYALHPTFTGSLGGLIALAEGKADIAGSHLWDAVTGAYNRPFIRRLLPGRRVALLTLAHRRLGLIVPKGNPAGVTGLGDLTRPESRFINRQRGAGTRVWLDAQLHGEGIAPAGIRGYDDEAATHSEVALAIAEGRADVGLGVEAAALAYGLGFVWLAREPYDLVIPAARWELPPIRALAAWLATEEAKATISGLGGYDVGETGRVSWVE